jgi:hypothetical protein
MLRFSISRSWKFIFQINQDLAQFLELNQLASEATCPTLIQLRIEVGSESASMVSQNGQMVLPVKDFNEIVRQSMASLLNHNFSSLDELTLAFQQQIQSTFKEYCLIQQRSDLYMQSFELEFENGLKLKVQNNDLELQDHFRLNVVHELATDESPIHGHDMKVGVALGFKNWWSSPGLTSLQNFSEELKMRTQSLVLKQLQKTKLNRHFLMPTGEQISAYFFRILKKTKIGPYLKEVRVYETAKNQYSIR